MVTRSALRTGWLARGLRPKMPEPRWMRSVSAAQWPRKTSLEEVWEYSARPWCSLTHTYFQLCRSAVTTSSTSFMSARCSPSVVWAAGPGDVALQEHAEFHRPHGGRLSAGRASSDHQVGVGVSRGR